MLKKAIATMVIGCVIGLSFGAMSRDSHAAGEVELAVVGQRSVESTRTILAEKCGAPPLAEIAAARTQMAMGGRSPAMYIASRDAVEWLARCRAAFGWAVSVWNQTPEGRAYLARVVAHINERLRLECSCEGVWITLDPAFANGSAFGTGNVQFVTETASLYIQWDAQAAFDNLSQAQKDFLKAGGALALATLVNLGVLTGPQATLLAAYLAFEWYRARLMQIDAGGNIVGGGGGEAVFTDRTPER